MDVPPWGVRERLMLEKSAWALSSGHLFDESARKWALCADPPERTDRGRETQTVAGIISDFRVVSPAKGRQEFFNSTTGGQGWRRRPAGAVITAFRDLLRTMN